MTTFWSLWIIVLTSSCIILVTWVLLANRRAAVHPGLDPDDKTTGHVYDGIVEYNNPLPRWWFVMFILSIVFAAVYLVLYPGMGSWKGTLAGHRLVSCKQIRKRAKPPTPVAMTSTKICPSLSLPKMKKP